MDKNFVGTQYIICECGDNFPNEKLLNFHLAHDHADVDPFQCEYCPEILPSAELYDRHFNQHNAQKPKKTPSHNPKTGSKKDPSLNNVVKKETKSPPVIKVQNLKPISAISLIQGLKGFNGLLKLQCSTTKSPVLEQSVQEKVIPEKTTEETGELVIVKNEIVQDDAQQYEEEEEIYYQCDVCNTIFYTEADFNVHYQSTHAMKTEVTPEDILENHLITDHIGTVGIKTEVEDVESAYYYECEICHKIFSSEDFFHRHYNKVHANLLPAENDTDNIQAASPEDQTQEESLEPTEDQDYSIEAYQSMQPIDEDLAEPIQPGETKSSPKAPEPEQVIYFKCDLCKILFPSEKGYNSHFNKRHGPSQSGFHFIEQDLAGIYPPPGPHNRDEFCCEFCPKTFNMKRSLQVHRKRVHPDRLPPSAPGDAAKTPSRSKVCDICGRAYNSNAALRYHQRRHTGEKPYPCTMCPKRFTMPMFLQIHLRTHTGEKPYECNQCPKAFTNKAALIRHDRVHTGIKPYPCPECGKYFTQSNSMKLHVSTVHLKLPAPYKSKNRRNKSEARALQLALKNLPNDIIEEDVIDD